MEKALEEYSRSKKNGPAGRRADCKACQSKDAKERYYRDHEKTKEAQKLRSRARRDKTKLDHWIVYELPIAHYVGMTQNPPYRMEKHEQAGRDTRGWRVLAKFDCPIEAHIYETQQHLKGFDGFGYRTFSKQ